MVNTTLHSCYHELATYIQKQFEVHSTIKLLNILYDKFNISDVVLAGGAIRAFYENRDAADIDLYLLDAEPTTIRDISKALNVSCHCLDQIHKYINVLKYETNHLMSIHYDGILDLKRPVNTQSPKPEFVSVSSPDEIISSFDLTCCQGAVTVSRQSDNYFTLSDVTMTSKFLPDVCKRQLKLTKPTVMYVPPVGLRRLYKYVSEYGYKIQDEEFFRSLNGRINTYVKFGGCYGDSYD